jgi:hypothetical protein
MSKRLKKLLVSKILFMKKIFCFCLLAILSVKFLPAQPLTTGFDSLAISKTKKTKYRLAHPVLTSMQLKTKTPKRSSYTLNQAVGDGIGKLFTAILPGLTSSEEMNWELQHEIETNIDNLSWKLKMYCPGELEKTTERVRNSDGSKSVNVERQAILFWERGSSAILLEKEDTIGSFMVSVNPGDSLFRKTSDLFPVPSTAVSRESRWQQGPAPKDFVLAGMFRNEPLQIFFDARSLKAWIYRNQKLQAVFQSDVIETGKPSLRRTAPLHLLSRPGVSEKELTDCLLLAGLSQLVATSVNTEAWEK